MEDEAERNGTLHPDLVKERKILRAAIAKSCGEKLDDTMDDTMNDADEFDESASARINSRHQQNTSARINSRHQQNTSARINCETDASSPASS